MNYHLTVTGFQKGLNLVLSGMHYDFRTKRVSNSVKSENDQICIWAIRQHRRLRATVIDKPIVIHYKFYWANKKMDRMNIASAFDKSYLAILNLAVFDPVYSFWPVTVTIPCPAEILFEYETV